MLCPGPGHSAKDRSLSVKLDAGAPDGFVVHSFSTDDPIACRDYVREKAGLPAFKSNGNARQRVSDDVITRAVMAAAGAQTRNSKPSGKVAKTYDYTDADGVLLYQVRRYEPKDFDQRAPDGNGGWIDNLDQLKGRRVLYRLPELLTFPDATVFITEGEKDADRVAGLALCATTVASGKWTGECTQALSGRDVIILEDNDAAGRKKALATAQALHDSAKTIRIVSLPDLADGGDVSDWLDADPHRADQLTDICVDAPVWSLPSIEVKFVGADAPVFNARELNDMRFEPIKYVVPGIIVEGLTLIAGKPKIGKSWLLLHAGVAVASGSFTMGLIKCPEGDVLYCALEDNPRRLQSRLTKLLGIGREWPSRLEFRCEMPRLTAGGIDVIKQWIEKAAQPRLIIIDTLAMVRTPPKSRTQTMYDADYEAVLELRTLANKYNVAIILVHHLRKQEADDAFDTVSGTLGLTGAPDTVLVLKRETNGNTILHGRGRDLVEIEKAMIFNKEACTWTITGDAHEVKLTSERVLILDALREAEKPVGPKEVASATGMKAVNVRKLLSRLARDGDIQKANFGKYTLDAKQREPEQAA